MEFDQVCNDLAVVQECSEKVQKNVGVASGKIKQQVQESFGEENNQVLRKFSEEKYDHSIVYFPSVIINNIIYRGNVEPFEVYEVICSSLTQTPEGCEGYVPPTVSSLSTWIIFVIILTIIFGIFLVVCFRRVARRQLSQKINNQVNQLVNQYITMYETDRYTQAAEIPDRNMAAHP